MAGLKQKTLSEENLTALLALIGEVQDSPTANTTLARLKDLLTGIVLAAGTNAIGKLAANSGVDIGDVDVLSIAAGTNVLGKMRLVTALGDEITDDTLDAIKALSQSVKAVEAITDWTAVAQNTIAKSGVLGCSGHCATLLHIQAALDTVTAHTGTRFIIQASSATSGDEDWQNYTEFVGLIGTAATDLIENNPLAAASTSITLTAHALTVLGKWLLIEDGTLANSELVFESAQSANAITILDGTTNAHALNTAIFNVALSQALLIDPSVYRVRLVVDNSYDSDGSTLNYKIRATKATSL